MPFMFTSGYYKWRTTRKIKKVKELQTSDFYEISKNLEIKAKCFTIRMPIFIYAKK